MAASKFWRAAIFGAAALAFFLKTLIALKTYGTNDAYTYELFSAWSQALGVAAYHYWAVWIHPPFTLHMLRAFAWAAHATNLPFSFWLRFTGIVADVGSLWLVCRMLRERLGEPAVALAVVFYALSPAGLMISGFHGNTDPLMVFFVLLGIFSAQRLKAPWISGAALAASMGFKVVPLILVPIFLLYFDNLLKRLQFLVALVGALLLMWSPYVFQEPGTIVNRIFGYKSLTGLWGISWLLSRASEVIPEYGSIVSVYQQYGAWVLFALLTVLSFRLNRSALRQDLFGQAGVVLLVFMTFVNGFGVQYLAWLTPFVVALGAGAAGVYYVCSGAFLFAVYNFWSEGLPWYLADSNRVGAWHGSIESLQFLCWLSVAAAAWLAWKRAGAPGFSPDLALRVGLYAPAALAVIASLHVTREQPLFRQSWSGSGEAALAAIRARDSAELSTVLRQLRAAGRSQ